MTDLKNIDEHFVQNLWNDQRFFSFDLKATDKRSIQVLKPGTWNSDEGPDFVHAEILIDGKLHMGDVEIHVRSSEWYNHKHHLNPRYNRVVLHVVFFDDDINLRTRVQSGERIPTIELSDWLDAPIGELFDEREQARDESIQCRVTGRRLKIEPLKSVFDKLGQERLEEKVDTMRTLRIGIDFEQLLYEGIMDALGYSKNRKPFRELARRVPFSQLTGKSSEEIQAVLFGVAGLLPSQSCKSLKLSEADKPFIDRLETLWKSSEQYKSPTRMTADAWRLAKIRPANYPTRRIPAISLLIAECQDSLMTVFLPIIEEATSENRRGLQRIRRKLFNLLTLPSSGYWTDHSYFGKGIPQRGAALIGRARASEIIVNILLPIALVWAEESQSSKLRDAVQRLYDSHPKLSENHITQRVKAQVFTQAQPIKLISPSAKKQQGAIYLYKTFCNNQICDLCPIIGGGGVDDGE